MYNEKSRVASYMHLRCHFLHHKVKMILQGNFLSPSSHENKFEPSQHLPVQSNNRNTRTWYEISSKLPIKTKD